MKIEGMRKPGQIEVTQEHICLGLCSGEKCAFCLQVSKCEKFGYGYMMSQVAATPPGTEALQQTGLFSMRLLHFGCQFEGGGL